MRIPILNIHIMKDSSVKEQANRIKKNDALLRSQRESITYLNSQVEDHIAEIDRLKKINEDLKGTISRFPEKVQAAVKKRESQLYKITNGVMSGILAENVNLMYDISMATGTKREVSGKSLFSQKELAMLKKIGA